MPDQRHEPRRRRSSSLVLGLVALAALAGFLILEGHGNHMLAYAPLLILLACPLMHLFMHHGHGGHGGHARGPDTTERASSHEP